MTRNPWCAPIDTVRDVLYDETRPFVLDSSSLFEGIVKAAFVTAAIEIDTALLRRIVGCSQTNPPARVEMRARAIPMGIRAVVSVTPRAYWKVTPIT